MKTETPPENTSSVSAAMLLPDALAHPWRKWGWWLVMFGAAGAFFFVLSWGVLSGRIMLILAVMAAIFVRCYFSVIESTITGYGEEDSHGSGLRMDEFWETLGRVLIAALIAWGPVVVGGIALAQSDIPLEPWLSVLGAFGCEYFPMALLGIVNFGGMHGAFPQNVFPAIFRCGWTYMLAGLGLLLVPYTFFLVWRMVPGEGLGPILAASGAATYVLIAHSRLIARIYLANQERIGW